jgi:ribosomal protein L11 methyltransferase
MNGDEITIKVGNKDSDSAAAIANMTVPYGMYIEDYSDLEEKAEEIAHINLIDESLLAKNREISLIHIYIAETDNALEALEFLKERFTASGIDFEVTSIGVNDNDWNENWKKYFHSTEIGERLAIVPSWETYENKDNRVLLHIDPGAAFGTGTHATTSLCLKILESRVSENIDVLDIGCGSGILAIASVLLGAKRAVGVDIDSQSVKTAKENAEINKIADKCEFIHGDLAEKVSGKYQVICANIVADIIIKLFENVSDFMTEDGVLIISGIIDLRKDDVLTAAKSHGFTVVQEEYKDNWCAYVLKCN